VSPGDAGGGRSADGADRLDRAFAALAHPTRRSLLQRLGRVESANVTELAEPYDVSLMAVSKHLKVLGEAGLVDRKSVGRERRYALRADGLGPALSWLLDHQAFWTERLDALAAVLESESGGEATDG
jgi:DNA-binding transcriptional ArsR family regulator